MTTKRKPKWKDTRKRKTADKRQAEKLMKAQGKADLRAALTNHADPRKD